MNFKYKIAAALWTTGTVPMAGSFIEFMPNGTHQTGIGVLILSAWFWFASLQKELERKRKLQTLLNQIDAESIEGD